MQPGVTWRKNGGFDKCRKQQHQLQQQQQQQQLVNLRTKFC